MDYTKEPKQFVTNLRKKGKKGRKYVNHRGSMNSINITHDHHIINLEYEQDCRIYTEQSLELTPDEVIRISKELNTNYNIWHIPAMDIISILKKWGKIQ